MTGIKNVSIDIEPTETSNGSKFMAHVAVSPNATLVRYGATEREAFLVALYSIYHWVFDGKTSYVAEKGPTREAQDFLFDKDMKIFSALDLFRNSVHAGRIETAIQAIERIPEMCSFTPFEKKMLIEVLQPKGEDCQE